MVFSTLFFVFCFLTGFFLLYFLMPNIHLKNALLIIVSLLFYAWGEPVYVVLLLFSTIFNYLIGLCAGKFKDKIFGKITIIFSLVVNIGMLLLFKYSVFICDNLNSWFSLDLTAPNIKGIFTDFLNTQFSLSIPHPSWCLPIGISFYTFQAMSYTIDCYWDTVKPQKNYFKFLLYVSLFPQLIAGPIVRYSVIEEEISSRKISAQDLSRGATRFIVGLAKKVILANNLYVIVEDFFGGDIKQLSVAATWYTVAVYALYVYFDFSGYSDMAIGIGNILGFHFNENFNYPFICKDITEFWQRWHISLGTFFKDYLLYVPIFGKRRQTLSLFLVWFCTGAWHGASWNFIIWGLYFGTFIFIERLIGKKRIKKIPVVIRHIYNKLVIIIGFGIFYFENLPDLGNFFKNLVGLNGNALIDESLKINCMNNIIIIAVSVLACFPIAKLFKTDEDSSYGKICIVNTSKVLVTAALFILCGILMVDSTSNPFLYFRF